MMTSTPSMPAPTAAQRRMPTTSPSNGMESTVTTRGATKPMEAASASGKVVMQSTNNSEEAVTHSPRTICVPGNNARNV